MDRRLDPSRVFLEVAFKKDSMIEIPGHLLFCL